MISQELLLVNDFTFDFTFLRVSEVEPPIEHPLCMFHFEGTSNSESLEEEKLLGPYGEELRPFF
jgi:hypothetical protein